MPSFPIAMWNVLQSAVSGCLDCLCSVVCIVLIAMFYETAWTHSPSAPLLEVMSESTAIPTIYNIFSSPIDTISWKEVSGASNLDKMMEIGRLRRPLVIEGAPSTLWKANRKWRLSQSPQDVMSYLTKLHYTNSLRRAGMDPDDVDADSIENLANDIVAVNRMNGSNFYSFHDRTRPLMAHQMVGDDSMSMLDAMETVNVSFYDFLGYLHNRKYSPLHVNRSMLYYYNSARNVYQDLKPLNWFKIRDRTVHFSDTLKRELQDINQINLDLSPTALFVNAHYEMAHSLFYQIEGSRRFLISPPSESLKLRSFPEGHPSFRSSQIPHKFYFIPLHLWISRKSHPFPPQSAKSKDRINAWSVVLEPGDLLVTLYSLHFLRIRHALCYSQKCKCFRNSRLSLVFVVRPTMVLDPDHHAEYEHRDQICITRV